MRISPVNPARSIVRVAPLEKTQPQRPAAPARPPEPPQTEAIRGGGDPLAGLQTALAQVTADRLAASGLTRAKVPGGPMRGIDGFSGERSGLDVTA